MIPKKLILKNFLSHSYSSINFDNFDVALILGKFNDDTDESNGSGKSSLLEAIRWVLFDKTRHKKKDKVVKRDAKSCSVDFEFEIAGNIYKIIRRRDKTIGESSVSLFQGGGENFTDIGCDTNSATDEKILKIINFNHETFINSVYFKQGDISIFADATAGKRKDILKALLKLEVWDEYQKRAKNCSKDYATKIEAKKSNLIDVEQLDEKIALNSQELGRVENLLKDKNNKYSELNRNLIAKKSNYNSFTEADVKDKIKKAQEEYSNAKKIINVERTEIKSINNSIKQNNLSAQKYEKKIEDLNLKISAASHINLEKLRNNLNAGKTKEQLIIEKTKILQKDINVGRCDFCFRPIDDQQIVNKIKLKRKEELRKQKENLLLISKKLKIAREHLNGAEKIHAAAQISLIEKGKTEVLYQNISENIKKMELEIRKKEEIIKQTDLSRLSKVIEDIKTKYNKENVDILVNEIEELELDAKNVKDEIDRLNIEYGVKANNKEVLNQQKAEQIELRKSLDKLNEEFLIYDKLKNYFGKDGIQSVIIENVVDELENYSNQILAKICNEPTRVVIKTQKQSDSGAWTETFDIDVSINGVADDLESLSGGEKFRISLALRLALSKILSKRMGGIVRFLLLDEVSSSLDNRGLNIFADIILKLGSEMKILVISHDDRLKNKINDVIVVNKDASGSKATI